MNDLIQNSGDSERTFTRRAFVLGSMQAGLLGVLGGRLAWLQIVEGQRYKTLAEQNRINVKILPPERGEITDRYGVPLAINRPDFRVLILPEQTDDIETALKQLTKYIDLSDRDFEKALEKAKKSARFVPVEIRGGLSREDVAKIEVNVPDLPGILTDVGEKRSYPFSEATAHLIGYVGAVTKEDLEKDDSPVLHSPGFRKGKSGLEKVFEDKLRGDAGRAEMEVNVHGREVQQLSQIPSQTGTRLSLTIDAELQRYAQQVISLERSASAVIMDIHSGAIYALVSTPSFDPNSFVDGISVEQYEELLANPAFPLNNKAITGQYPPGSTYKMISALTFLESGVADANTTVFCPGHYELGRDRFHCWKRGGHGWMSVVSALEQSCDTYFYKLSTEVGIDKIAEMSHVFGLGEKTGIELEGEKLGLIPTKNWKRGRFDAAWQPGETVVSSIGQGYTLATPLQLAVMTARLANGGKAVEPRLIAAINKERIIYPEWPSLDIKQKNLELVKKGMVRVMEGKKGTAASKQIPEEEYKMAGKTGTSQVKRITRAQRAAGIKNEDLPWKDRHHALFVGYAPIDNPKYACSVVVEHGIGGSRAAAPICRDLLRETQIRNPAATTVILGG